MSVRMNEKTPTSALVAGFTETGTTFDCLFCDHHTEQGRVYPLGDELVDAELAMRRHLETEHGSVFEALLALGKKGTGLSDEGLAQLRAAIMRSGRPLLEVTGFEDSLKRRMAIYRELFFNNLKSLLSNMFPVLKKLHTDDKWRRLVRKFMQRHQAQTPYFLQLPAEFLDFLQRQGNDLITPAHGRDHRLMFLHLLLLRPDQQEIHDREDQDEREKRGKCAATTFSGISCSTAEKACSMLPPMWKSSRPAKRRGRLMTCGPPGMIVTDKPHSS